MVMYTALVDGEKVNVSMDKWLHEQLTTKVKPQVMKKDFDYLFLVDGMEGSGKSVFAMQIAKVLDPYFDLSNIVFTPDQFITAVTTAKKYSCIVFDEAFTGMSSRASLSEINQLMVSLMMEMRQRNLFVIIVLPTIFMLDKYVALHRAKCLFHVYLSKMGYRGFWLFYNKQALKLLWLKGRKYYDYHAQKPKGHGVFSNKYTVSEENYRDKKGEAIKKKDRKAKKHKYKLQRDVGMCIMNLELGITRKKIAEYYDKYGIEIADRTVGRLIDDQMQTIDRLMQEYGENIIDKGVRIPK